MSTLLLAIETLYLFKTYLPIEDQFKLKAIYSKLCDITFKILDIDPLYRLYFNEDKPSYFLAPPPFWLNLYTDLTHPETSITYTIFTTDKTNYIK